MCKVILWTGSRRRARAGVEEEPLDVEGVCGAPQAVVALEHHHIRPRRLGGSGAATARQRAASPVVPQRAEPGSTASASAAGTHGEREFCGGCSARSAQLEAAQRGGIESREHAKLEYLIGLLSGQI